MPTREPFQKVDQIESLGQFLPTKEGRARGVRQRCGEGYFALRREWWLRSAFRSFRRRAG
jgi:hypothetical protein